MYALFVTFISGSENATTMEVDQHLTALQSCIDANVFMQHNVYCILQNDVQICMKNCLLWGLRTPELPCLCHVAMPVEKARIFHYIM